MFKPILQPMYLISFVLLILQHASYNFVCFVRVTMCFIQFHLVRLCHNVFVLLISQLLSIATRWVIWQQLFKIRHAFEDEALVDLMFVALLLWLPKLVQKMDACGVVGLSSIKKCTSAFHVLM
jgi:hypothetical protein